ncbi:peptidoglycan-binding protein [uncultured Paracoccus sp.]|uniref:peptidoglycan-binding protein n=1 Tax=uncultured Paracoccus sp. TaxID=189685 RepID=UPI0025EADAFA|nr:peptidoglycan-binding protein [uncultured Paracoccus sp.]
MQKLTVRDAQALLAEAGYYSGAIDGDAGPKTMAAVQIIERNAGGAGGDWAKDRRLVGAGQRVLGAMGYQPGVIDGYSGHNTSEALTAYHSSRAGARADVNRIPINARSSAAQSQWPTQANAAAFFGPAGGPACTAGRAVLPFAFPLAWDMGQQVKSFACHARVADAFTAIFAEAARHYGEAEYRRLRLDRFGGCYNNRAMRGSSAVSMHAYGIAVDLDPERNQLRWGADRAAFARPEYEPFWRIVMAEGGVPAGYAWGADWMHFQMCRLK